MKIVSSGIASQDALRQRKLQAIRDRVRSRVEFETRQQLSPSGADLSKVERGDEKRGAALRMFQESTTQRELKRAIDAKVEATVQAIAAFELEQVRETPLEIGERLARGELRFESDRQQQLNAQRSEAERAERVRRLLRELHQAEAESKADVGASLRTTGRGAGTSVLVDDAAYAREREHELQRMRDIQAALDRVLKTDPGLSELNATLGSTEFSSVTHAVSSAGSSEAEQLRRDTGGGRRAVDGHEIAASRRAALPRRLAELVSFSVEAREERGESPPDRPGIDGMTAERDDATQIKPPGSESSAAQAADESEAEAIELPLLGPSGDSARGWWRPSGISVYRQTKGSTVSQDPSSSTKVKPSGTSIDELVIDPSRGAEAPSQDSTQI